MWRAIVGSRKPPPWQETTEEEPVALARGTVAWRAVGAAPGRVMPDPGAAVSPRTPLRYEEDLGSQDQGDTSPIKSFQSKSACSIKSILKDTPSPDIKQRSGRALAWQDFHGKELTSVVEFVASDSETSDDDDIWEQKRACCTIM